MHKAYGFREISHGTSWASYTGMPRVNGLTWEIQQKGAREMQATLLVDAETLAG